MHFLIFLLIGLVSANNPNWITLSTDKPIWIAGEVLVVHLNMTVEESGVGTRLRLYTLLNQRLLSDSCGTTKLEYVKTLHDVEATIRPPLQRRKMIIQEKFDAMVEEILDQLINSDQRNYKYYAHPLKLVNELGTITVIHPLSLTIGNLVYTGCLVFYTAKDEVFNSCRDGMTMAASMDDGRIITISPRSRGWFCKGVTIDHPSVIEIPKTTIYSRVNNKTMIVIPGNDLVVVSILEKDKFDTLSQTTKNKSALYRCIKLKICLIRNLTNERRVYNIDIGTHQAYQLLKMGDISIPDAEYRVFGNDSISVGDDDFTEVLFIPVDSTYRTTVILLTILAAILGIIAAFLVVLTAKVLQSKKKEKHTKNIIYRELKELREKALLDNTAPQV